MDIYHVLNRGVEKRDVVLCDDDRMRFVSGLYVFNNTQSAPNSVSQPKSWELNTPRKCLVRIHAWCLMNNHYHLLLSPVDGEVKNISLFMKKLNMGYAKFFNEKYKRSGYLWQGKYKKILVSNDIHFEYIPYYIHLNALDYTNYEWRTSEVSPARFEGVQTQMKQYRWSSYQDYNGIRNFPSLLHTELFNDILKSHEHQTRQIKDIVLGNDQKHTQNSAKLET